MLTRPVQEARVCTRHAVRAIDHIRNRRAVHSATFWAFRRTATDMLHATRCLIPVPATPQPAALPRSVDELFAAYGNPIIRPGLANIDGTITQDKLGVSFGIDAPAGLDFNEQAHRWSVYGYMRTFWQDPRLRFNATAVGPQITLNNADFMHRIWQPDLYWERVSAVSGVANDDGYGENP